MIETPLSDFRKMASQYSQAVESVKQARGKLTELIIKYIIANGVDLGKCTELAISENLGLPRSTVRSILLDLVDENILRASEFGNTKPYVLTDFGVGIAIDWLNISFTKEEVNELLAAKRAEDLRGMLAGNPLMFSEIDGKRVAIYRGIAADQCLRTFIGRFFDYVEEGFYEKLRRAFGERTLKELELLGPELISFEILTTPTPPMGEWASKELRDLDEGASAEDVRKTIIKSFENNLKYVVQRLEKFAALLEEKGYDGMHAYFRQKQPSRDIVVRGKLPEFRFHDEFLWATTLAVRESCKVGEKIGADISLLKRARLLSDVLDLALEKKYRGAEAEGLSLIEWGLKQLS